MAYSPKRGDIWLVRLNPTVGDELQKTRPAIVISADGLEGLNLRLIVPITSWKSSFISIPWIVQIVPSEQNNLTKISAANPLQTRSVSLERFVKKIGFLDENTLETVILGLGLVVQFPSSL